MKSKNISIKKCKDVVRTRQANNQPHMLGVFPRMMVDAETLAKIQTSIALTDTSNSILHLDGPNKILLGARYDQ
jgi:hypothetical protein